ncbi:hypothetical protein [Geoglobus ahangari]
MQENYEMNVDAELILNPDYYLHLTIMQAVLAPHRALQQGNIREGLTSLIVAVDQLEKIAKASGRLKELEKYRQDVRRYEEELKDRERDDVLRRAMLANYKLELLLKMVFESLPKRGELMF